MGCWFLTVYFAFIILVLCLLLKTTRLHWQVILNLESLELFRYFSSVYTFQPVLCHPALGKSSSSRRANLLSASLIQLHVNLLIYTFCRHFLAGIPYRSPSRRASAQLPGGRATEESFRGSILKWIVKLFRLTIRSSRKSSPFS